MPDISKITLPSGSTYDIKDAVAREAIAGGVSFVIAWDGTSEPVVADIPAGVVVTYNHVEYTGTLAAASSEPGAFYLVKSTTTTSEHPLDVYDEYVAVGTPKTWEKIGDTQVDLSDVVTDITYTKDTADVIGKNSTFTVTQPTVSLSTGATAGEGVISVVTGITNTSASGDDVTALTGLGTPSTSSVLTGVKVTSDPDVTLTANASSATGRIAYVESLGTADTTKISATASGGSVSASGDSVTAVTGYASPTSGTFVTGVTDTTKKLATTSVTGVSGSTTASKATQSTSQTTADGAGTASTTNTDWLKGVSVSNEVLTIGAATMDTQTTTQFTFSDVTVPTAAASATTVATGKVANADTSGDSVVVSASASGTNSALTGLGTPSTDTVLGTSSVFSVTDPSVTISSGSTGDVTVATAMGSATTKYLSASASGTAVGANGTANAVTGYPNATTDTVVGTGSTITVTPTITNVKATATGGNTAWNNKDEKTVLTNNTVVSPVKGQ